MRRHLIVSLLSLGIATLLPGCNDSSSGPGGERFRATLSGANERPTARTTTATGVADLTFRNDTLFWVVNMTNLTNASAAHIHIGDANTAGGVIIPIATTPVSNTRIEGFITRAAYPATAPQGVTFDNLLERMRAGTVYVNVHTNDNVAPIDTGQGDFPNGEIRGQINPV
jgi:CHRD domain-containing protein